MRFCRPIIALALLLAATALPALAAPVPPICLTSTFSSSAPTQQLHPGTANKAGLYFKLEPGWHVYWKNPGDAGRTAPHQVDSARRHHRWSAPVSRSQATSARPVDGLRLRKRSALSIPGYRFCECSHRARPFSTPRSIGLFAAAVASPRKPSSKSRVRSHRLFPAAGTPVQPDHDIWARLASKLPQAVPANLKIGFVPTPTGFRLTAITGHRETEASFFPVDALTSSPTLRRRPQRRPPTASLSISRRTRTSPPTPKNCAASFNFQRPCLRTDCIGRRTIRS